MTNKLARLFLCAAMFVSLATGGAMTQVAAPATQMVNVEGRAMRVAVGGLEQRKPGQPVIVDDKNYQRGCCSWLTECSLSDSASPHGTELPQRRKAGCPRVLAALNAIANRHGEVALDLVVQIAPAPAAAKQTDERAQHH